MNTKQKLVSVLSIISGIILGVIGTIGVGFYIFSVIASLGQPDKSLIFWYLPTLFIGIVFLAAAVYFIIIGFKSLWGNEPDYKLVKNSLIIQLIFFFILLIVGTINSL